MSTNASYIQELIKIRPETTMQATAHSKTNDSVKQEN